MINIAFKTNGFVIDGHAVTGGPRGHNIICAAVSIASGMTANGLIEWAGLPRYAVKFKEKNGFLGVAVDPEIDLTPEAGALIDSFIAAMIELQEEHPDAVRITTEEEIINGNRF